MLICRTRSTCMITSFVTLMLSSILSSQTHFLSSSCFEISASYIISCPVPVVDCCKHHKKDWNHPLRFLGKVLTMYFAFSSYDILSLNKTWLSETVKSCCCCSSGCSILAWSFLASTRWHSSNAFFWMSSSCMTSQILLQSSDLLYINRIVIQLCYTIIIPSTLCKERIVICPNSNSCSREQNFAESQ